MSKPKVCRVAPCEYADREEQLLKIRDIEEKITRVRELRAERFQATAADLFGADDCTEARDLVAQMLTHAEGPG